MIKKITYPKIKRSITQKVRKTIDFVFGKNFSSKNKNLSLSIDLKLDSKNKPYIYIDKLSSIKGKTKLSDLTEVMSRISEYAKKQNISLIATNTWIFIKYPLFAQKLGFSPKDIVKYELFLKKLKLYEIDNVRNIKNSHLVRYIEYTSKKQPDKLKKISLNKLGSFPLFIKKI
jgi:hypothetical protein